MRFLLLACLSHGPIHGYELKRMYDRWFAVAWGAVNIGQIYVTMGRLERDGLVTVVPDDARKLYELTEFGRKELEAWIGAPVDPVHRSEVLLRLVAAVVHSPQSSAEVIRDHRVRCLSLLRELNDVTAADQGDGSGSASVQSLLVGHAAIHLDAELRWLDRVDDPLARGELRFTPPSRSPRTPGEHDA